MDKISLLFPINLVKVSGMNKKQVREKSDDDNQKKQAQCSTGSSSNNSGDEREENAGSNKRRLAIETRCRKYFESKPEKFKSCLRQGIHHSKRSVIWQLISGGRERLEANPGIYSLLLSDEFPQKSQSEKLIVKDIHRTLTSHTLFQTIDGRGHRSLYNVLKAYSVYDIQVGYTQGMNFIAGTLLLYLNEEEAFWVMVALLKGMKIRGMYLEGLPLLHEYLLQFEMLVKEQLPKVAKHFEKQMVRPAMYATSWFMTAFSEDLPFALVVRLWDVFLCEGMKAVFAMGLALLNYFKDDLLRLSHGDLLPFLQGFRNETLDADKLMPLAWSLMLKTRINGK